MSTREKIIAARGLLIPKILSHVQEEHVDEERPLLKITFSSGYELFIRYNDYEEYSYHVNFSTESLDRLRFDNYDDHWPVSTRPHHFHPCNEKTAKKSPMNGDPEHDMPLLMKFLPL